MLYHVHLALAGFELATLVVIGTDCTSSCRSNYYMNIITSTTTPKMKDEYKDQEAEKTETETLKKNTAKTLL